MEWTHRIVIPFVYIFTVHCAKTLCLNVTYMILSAELDVNKQNVTVLSIYPLNLKMDSSNFGNPL